MILRANTTGSTSSNWRGHGGVQHVDTSLHWVRYSLTAMIFAGVFGCYPRLQGDQGMLPSDYWHRSTVVKFVEDDIGVQLHHLPGVDNALGGRESRKSMVHTQTGSKKGE